MSEIHTEQKGFSRSKVSGALRLVENTAPKALAARPTSFGPGSDIANGHPDLLVQMPNDTHLLVINKFCIARPQLLLLTADSYRRRPKALSQADLAAAWTVL